MHLELDDFEYWEDEEVMEALNEIESGLRDSQLELIDSYTKQLHQRSYLTDRQREVAEDILRKWNEKHGG